ncbi:ester cyclase [Edaphobacter bradus]|uniref:ester cyclase n=1 Tax=Edaphobacter bradus TaxID=2259016 RepID=UPI0021DF4BEE|nr:ester cyclase [Edaphobacter bradus]
MITETKPLMDNKQLAHRFMDECWNLGKLDCVRELISEDCRIHDPVFPSLTSGAANMMRHIALCRSGFPDLNFTIDDTVAEHSEVVLHWTAQGTHQALFLGIPPTNRKVTVSGTSIYRIENSQIVEIWADWNLMTLMQQLGVSTTPKVEARTNA